MKKIITFIFFSLVIQFTEARDLTIIKTHQAWLNFPAANTFDLKLTLAFPKDKEIQQLNQTTFAQLDEKKKKNLSLITLPYLETPTYSNAMNAGVLYAKNGVYSIAIDWFNKAILMDPEKSEPYNAIANVHYLSGDMNEALAWYTRSLKYKKDDPSTLLNLAFIYYETGERDKAKNCYLKATLIDPTLDKPEYQIILE